ncbi:MAG: hypothetical protein R3185_00310 [Candidatus Thermoplasmatota archaeon]|nr:hypothetical protein [Candidatus Thermoplasmatota archaeon]
MTLRGSRVVGLLILWLSIGFLVDAFTWQTQAELLADLEQSTPPAGSLFHLATASLGIVLAGIGSFLLMRDPGPGLTPEVPLGEEHVPDEGPRRCYRCRAPWPANAETCPRCQAERLR